MQSFTDIINSDKLTLVDFFATWCGPCQSQLQVLPELKSVLGDNVTILKIDVDKNQELAMKYHVSSVPTLMLFKSGEMKWREAGFHDLDTLKGIVGLYR